MDTEKPALTDPQVPPSVPALKSALGASYAAYRKLIDTICDEPYRLAQEWKYFRDGKAWLCKITFKKKTVFWLSAWQGYFKAGFYFTSKNSGDIAGLPIHKKAKEAFATSASIGKLLPLVISVTEEKHIKDIILLAEYKKGKL